MNNSNTLPLHELLRATAQDLAARQPPATAAAATLAAMQRALPRPTPSAPSSPTSPVRGAWAGWRHTLALSSGVSFAVVLLGAALLLTRPPLHRTGSPVAAATDFVPVVSPERWAGYLQASEAKGASQDATAWIVSTEIQGERLALLGLPYDPSQAGERVRAELLMHESGDVLAVRIVR